MTGLTLVIGNKNYSTWSMRPWVCMKHHEIPFTEKLIPLDTPTAAAEKLDEAPNGRVPVLHDGDFTVWDSIAICEYLAERFPEKGLWPTAPKARARARSLCAEMHAGFLAMRTEMPMNCRARRTRRDRGPAVARDVARILECWRTTQDEFGAGEDEGSPFLFGGFTIADAFFVPVASRFFTYDIELDPFAMRYIEALFTLPAVQQWMMEAEMEPMQLPDTDCYE